RAMKPSASSPAGYPPATYNYPVSASETIVAGTEKYGAPSFPSGGFVDPYTIGGTFNTLPMVFLGDVQKQTPAGRTAESRIFMTSVTTDNSGNVTVGNPDPMPFDPNVQKG